MTVAHKSLPYFPGRNILHHQTLQACIEIVEGWHPDARIQAVAIQGGCSYTVIVVPALDEKGPGSCSQQRIVQFRLSKHALDVHIVHDARAIYGDFVPEPLRFSEVTREVHADARSLVVQICEMSVIPGKSFASLQPHRHCLSLRETRGLRQLMIDMARFFARGWNDAVACQRSQTACTGKVGSSILTRLVRLEHELPSAWLRRQARAARRKVQAGQLDAVPIVLNHGDLLPSNIMVDVQGWAVHGVVDWAEAEYTPFGIALYGVEHLLGYTEHGHGRSSGKPTKSFRYYEQANDLRRVFWDCLQDATPVMRESEALHDAVLLSRTVGILLWHGFAWDDGNIDRVVNAADDQGELAYLDAFLSTCVHTDFSRL